MSLTFAVLARDEQRCLARCLESLLENGFDRVMVIDTGSLDATAAIAKSYADRGVTLHHFQWPGGFAAARNAALDLIAQGWVAFLDADEWLGEREGDRVREALRVAEGLADNEHLVLCPLIANTDGTVLVGPGRILRAEAGIRYFGAVHEEPRVVTPAVGTVEPIVTDLVWHHDGYEPAVVENKEKRKRYAQLLADCRQEEPDNARWIFHELSDGLQELPLDEIAAICARLDALAQRLPAGSAQQRMAEHYHGAGLRLACRRYAAAAAFAELREAGRALALRLPESSDAPYYLGVLRLLGDPADAELNSLLLDLITARRELPEPEPGALHPYGLHLDTLIAAVLDGLGQTQRAAQYRASLDGAWTDAFFVKGRLI